MRVRRLCPLSDDSPDLSNSDGEETSFPDTACAKPGTYMYMYMVYIQRASTHLANQDTSLSGHLTNQDTSLIRTPH